MEGQAKSFPPHLKGGGAEQGVIRVLGRVTWLWGEGEGLEQGKKVFGLCRNPILCVNMAVKGEERQGKRPNKEEIGSGPWGFIGRFSVREVRRAVQAWKEGRTQVLGLIAYNLE